MQAVSFWKFAMQNQLVLLVSSLIHAVAIIFIMAAMVAIMSGNIMAFFADLFFVVLCAVCIIKK